MSLSPQTLLSTASRERCIANLKKLPPITLHSEKPTIVSSVLVPLCVENGEVCLLYTQRSILLKAHSGQVCFPGGKSDEEETVVDTALRETEEEIGISRENIDVWGEMSPVQGRDPKMIIHPVVALIKNFDFNTFVVNRDEVEEVFTVPMSVLCDKNNHGCLDYKPPLPLFIHGKFNIWGITGLITHIFLQSFLPEDVYKFNFKSKKFTLDELMPSKL